MSYTDLVVKEKINETADAVTLVFENPDGNKVFYKPGQFLTFIFDINDKEERRCYSLCSSTTMDEEMAVTIKKVDGGIVSNYIYDKINTGDNVKVMLPMGNFTTDFDVNADRNIVFLAGGSGITPIMSLIKTFLKKEPNTKLNLVYANRGQESIIFAKQFDQLSIQYPEQLRIIHVLEKAPEDWHGFSGMLDEDLFGKLVNEFTSGNPKSGEYFVCGPQGLMDMGITTLEKLKVEKSNTHKESFVAAVNDSVKADTGGASGSNDDAGEYEVTVRYMGDEHKFMVGRNDSILLTALDKGIDLPFSCQSGLCTACMGKCVSGKVELDESDSLTDKELEEGYILTCVGHPASENVVIEIE